MMIMVWQTMTNHDDHGLTNHDHGLANHEHCLANNVHGLETMTMIRFHGLKQ
jgi:hypothetical protein